MTGIALGSHGASPSAALPDTLPRGRRRVLVGLILILHGLAHSNGVTWASDTLPAWAATMFWSVAVLGYLGAGFGMLGVPVVRHMILPLVSAATLASFALLALVGGTLALVGVAIDISFLAMVERNLQRLAGPPLSYTLPLPGEPTRWQRVGRAIGAVCLLYVTAVVVMHPVYLTWGTTPAERAMALPGDPSVSGARYRVDHGITIQAPADSIWPWLIQLGQDRGGFYSHAWLERLFGVEVTNADRIHPEWQVLAQGDFVRATQREYLGGRFGDLGWRVSEFVPGRALVLDKWGAFVLQPIDANNTRFLIRARGDGAPSLPGVFLGPLGVFVFEPAHFIMQRKMMSGIRDRAEGMMQSPSRAP